MQFGNTKKFYFRNGKSLIEVSPAATTTSTPSFLDFSQRRMTSVAVLGFDKKMSVMVNFTIFFLIY